MIYDIDSTDKAAEYDVSYSGVGNMKLFKGTAVKDSMIEEYKKTFEFPEFINSIDIRRKDHDDARDKSVFNMVAEFAEGAARTKEAHAAEIFNLAFTAVGEYSSEELSAGPDGKALCASDHPSVADDGYEGSNTGTLAMSPNSVEATRIAMKGITDGRGNKSRLVMDMLLCPIGLEEIAWEIINSKGKVDTADNNRNFHQGRYKLAVWDELTDSTAWFGIDSKRMKRHLAWFNRVPIENWKKFDEDLQTLTFGVYGRWGLGFNGWRWVFGQKPA